MTYFPEFNVTRSTFSECAPKTVDGIRALAYIVLVTPEVDAQGYVDDLELLMLQAMHIKPEGVFDWPDEIKPIEIEHARRRGARALKVRWLHSGFDNCEACYDGKLSATGKDGHSYKVECPECCGSGKVDRDPEYIETDIDGEPWRLAA